MDVTARPVGWEARRPGIALARVGSESSRRRYALMTAAIMAALALAAIDASIVGRGDYGQWLMTSRFYLGQSIPAYRVISDLPPLVPVAMAAVRAVVPNDVIALQLTCVGWMVAFAASIHFAAITLWRRPVAGVLAVTASLLLADRFLELFAFGGLLQIAGLVWINLAVATLIRAGDGRGSWRWWLAGGASIVLLELSHVGTATVGLPIAFGVAALSTWRLRRVGAVPLLRRISPFLGCLALAGVYGFLVLLPQSRDYVANPASLGYRGPDRLFSSLFAYWPTTLVVLTGALSVVLAFGHDLRVRRLDRGIVLLAWSGIAWGSLAASALAGTATDFPRFAPVVLAPLAVASAGTGMWVTRQLGHAVARALGSRIRVRDRMAVAAWVLILLAAPFALARYETLVRAYQPLEATGLSEAVDVVDQQLGSQPGAVLAAVRDGKWLEGVTGRESLFSQPVRYAFRPDEWERSVEADALLQTTAALTSQYFFVKFSDRVSDTTNSAVTGLTVAMNHGGEFLDVLQVRHTATQVLVRDGTQLIAERGPAGMSTSEGGTTVGLTTRWRPQAGTATAAFRRSVTLRDGGTTMTISDSSPGNRLRTTLSVPDGMAITSLAIDGREAQICLTEIGGRAPCLRVFVAPADATLSGDSVGLTATTTSSSQLKLLITDLTPGGVSTGMNVLDPERIALAHDIRAVLLVATDPAYSRRAARLGTIGFRVTRLVGRYAVLIRSADPARSLAGPGP